MNKVGKNGDALRLEDHRSVKTDEFYLDRMREILAVDSNARPPSEPVEMLENVFMGSQKHAEDFDLLRRYGITHIVNCAGSKLVNCSADQDQRSTTGYYPERAGIAECLIIGAVDHEDYDISVHFDKAINFLNSAEKKGGKALVHCNLGVNRSGAIMAAYLMARQKMSLLRVIDYIKQKRSVALSNRGFRKQLISFARKRGLLEESETMKSKRKTNVLHSADDHSPQQTPVVRFQSFDHWINCEELDSKMISQEVDSRGSLKNRIQSAIKPQISGRFWSFSRSFVRWRGKPVENKNQILADSSDVFRQLDPVYEHSGTDDIDLSTDQGIQSRITSTNIQTFFKPSAARRSNSFLSLLKIPGRRAKSSSLSDFQSLHPSSASITEEFDSATSSSAMRPLRISQSVGNNITLC